MLLEEMTVPGDCLSRTIFLNDYTKNDVQCSNVHSVQNVHRMCLVQVLWGGGQIWTTVSMNVRKGHYVVTLLNLASFYHLKLPFRSDFHLIHLV